MNIRICSKISNKIISIFLAILLMLGNCAYVSFAEDKKTTGNSLNVYSSADFPDQVKLRWDNILNDAEGYTIERSEDGVDFTEIAKVTNDRTSYRDYKNLKPGTVYHYRIKAEGSSEYSGTTVSTPEIGEVIKESMTVWEKVDNTFRTTIKETAPGEKVTELSQTYTFSKPVVSKEGDCDVIEIPEGKLSLQDTNKPVMPFKSVNILIPYGFDAVGATVITGKAKRVGGFHSIEPARNLALVHTKGGPSSRDPRIYHSNNVYPFEPAGDIVIQDFKGYKIAVTILYPLVYHPKSKKVYYYPEMQVKLDLVPSVEVEGLSAAQVNEDKENVSSLVDNPEVIGTYRR